MPYAPCKQPEHGMNTGSPTVCLPSKYSKPNRQYMSCLRALLCIIFPPLAVLDKGCGSILLVFVLTLCAWVPGVIGAILICNKK